MKLLSSRKVCIVCGKLKPFCSFPKYKTRKGKTAYKNQCKVCSSLYKRQHYLNNREKYLERSKNQRIKDPVKYKEYLKSYYREHSEERKISDKEYAKKNREKINSYHRYWRSLPQNSVKKDAWKMVQLALKFNILQRPNCCSNCGVECKPEAHHNDYNKPLDVVWLCKSCHENIHHLNEGDVSLE